MGNLDVAPRAGWSLAGLALMVAAGCAGPEPAPEAPASPGGDAARPPAGPDSQGGILIQGAPAPAPQHADASAEAQRAKAEGPAAGPAPESRPIEVRPLVLDDPQQDEHGSNLLYLGEVSKLPLDPLRVHNNHQLHNLFYIPPMEGAETLEAGTWALRLGLDMSNGSGREVDARFFYNYKGTMFQTDWQARYGLGEGTEVGAVFDFSELFGSSEKTVVARDGKELVREGSRAAGIGDIVFSLKKRLIWEEGSPEGLSVTVALKVPVDNTRNDLLTSGEIDTAVQAAYSHKLGDVLAHVDFGFVIPGRDKVFLEDVTLRDPFTIGAGMAWPVDPQWVVLGQIQGHQSVFDQSQRSLSILDDNLFSIHGGARTRIGSYFLESSLGKGIGSHASSSIFTLSLEVRF